MTTGMPRVTVLLVTYNHLTFIDAAIASIEAQRIDGGLEVVVADDSSTDGTRERLERWAAESALDVRLLPGEARLGITLNYARAFAAARGDYIAVLEGDDEWLSDEKLAIQADHLDAHPHQPMVVNRILLYHEHEVRWSVIPAIGFASLTTELRAPQLAISNWFATFSACMYRAEAIERISPEVFETTAYDWMVNLAVMEGGPAGFVPQVMTLYRQHSGGEWSAASPVERDLRIRDLLPRYIELASPEVRPELTRLLHIIEGRLALAAAAPAVSAEGAVAHTPFRSVVPRTTGAPPRVSVVMASYGHERWISESIASVLDQTMGDIELIIVDDGSFDRTVQAAAAFDDPRIRLYPLGRNQGAAAALNLAVQQARSDLVAVINSDDMWMPTKLARQLEVLDAQPEVVAVFTGAGFVGEDSKPLPISEIPQWHEVFRQPDRSQAQWLRFLFESGNALCHPSVLLRRHFYEDRGLYDNRMRQIPDLQRWIELVKYGPIRVLGAENLVAFRLLPGEQNASSTGRANVVRGLHEHLAIAEGFFDNCSDEMLIEAFGDRMREPRIASAAHRRAEIAMLWWTVPCAMQSVNRIHALRALREALGDEETAMELRTRFDFGDLDLQAWAGQEESDLPAASPDWLASLEDTHGRYSALVMHSNPELAAVIWSRIRRTPVTSWPGKVRRLFLHMRRSR
jgi:glycosyltransferase involved in cell wall biosynthesis